MSREPEAQLAAAIRRRRVRQIARIQRECVPAIGDLVATWRETKGTEASSHLAAIVRESPVAVV
jgi:hypothetical protein